MWQSNRIFDDYVLDYLHNYRVDGKNDTHFSVACVHTCERYFIEDFRDMMSKIFAMDCDDLVMTWFNKRASDKLIELTNFLYTLKVVCERTGWTFYMATGENQVMFSVDDVHLYFKGAIPKNMIRGKYDDILSSQQIRQTYMIMNSL